MKASKDDIENAILRIAELINEEKGYRVLLEETTLPEIIKNLVYDLFLINIENISDLDEYKVYLLIREYVAELKSKGFVTFEN